MILTNFHKENVISYYLLSTLSYEITTSKKHTPKKQQNHNISAVALSCYF
ncbi:hypothetical protein SAMN04489761_3524 [Tenacibaculum sp. MAR_2009_124]|nr:hypothetical protein SAMN04489761_3524 [Tenacibaculum sp. MAR_2009_124]